jgi:8-oxo-dGTP pyrophosphatase MutT (NUDIX family)
MKPQDSQIHFWAVLVVMGPEGSLAAVEYDPPSEPRQAATVILLRGGDAALEVLLLRRNPAARFMGGAWVFPGGALDAGEAHRTAGVREVAEEAGVELADPAALVPFSRWITPAHVRTRYDTTFFLAPLPPGAEPRVDGGECVALGWFTPREALDADGATIALVFPTITTLEQLERFGSAAELLEWAAGRDVEPIEPQLLREGEVARLVLPGEPGYRC